VCTAPAQILLSVLRVDSFESLKIMTPEHTLSSVNRTTANAVLPSPASRTVSCALAC
jgi:hypothetical protein